MFGWRWDVERVWLEVACGAVGGVMVVLKSEEYSLVLLKKIRKDYEGFISFKQNFIIKYMYIGNKKKKLCENVWVTYVCVCMCAYKQILKDLCSINVCVIFLLICMYVYQFLFLRKRVRVEKTRERIYVPTFKYKLCVCVYLHRVNHLHNIYLFVYVYSFSVCDCVGLYIWFHSFLQWLVCEDFFTRLKNWSTCKIFDFSLFCKKIIAPFSFLFWEIQLVNSFYFFVSFENIQLNNYFIIFFQNFLFFCWFWKFIAVLGYLILLGVERIHFW